MQIPLAVPLQQEREERDLVTLEICGHSFVHERETLKADTSSSLVKRILTTKLAEGSNSKIRIELPIDLKLAPDLIKLAIDALFKGELPQQSLEINQYIDLALFFRYFEANDLLKASAAKIASRRPNRFEWITLLRLPDEVVDGVIAGLSERDSAKLLKAMLELSIEAVQQKFGSSTTASIYAYKRMWSREDTEKIKIIEEIRGDGWSVNIRRLIIALMHQSKTDPTKELLDYFGADIALLRSANLLRSIALTERFLTSCPNITHLIFDCSWPDTGISLAKLLEKWPNLLYLRLISAKGDASKALAFAPNLEELNIAYCQELNKDALEELPSKLKVLRMEGCLTLDLKHLDRVPMLEVLNVNGCRYLPTDALKHLASVPELKELNMGFCRSLEEDALKHLSFVPNLEALDVGVPKGDVDLKHLANVPRLRRLSMQGLKHFAPDGLKYLALVPELTHLFILCWYNAEPDALKHLHLVPRLRHLSIKGCEFEPDALKHLALVPELTELNVENCKNLEPDALKHLARVPELTELNVENCKNLEPDALKHLISVPGLTRLNILYCTSLKSDALKHLIHTPLLVWIWKSDEAFQNEHIPQNLSLNSLFRDTF